MNLNISIVFINFSIKMMSKYAQYMMQQRLQQNEHVFLHGDTFHNFEIKKKDKE